MLALVLGTGALALVPVPEAGSFVAALVAGNLRRHEERYEGVYVGTIAGFLLTLRFMSGRLANLLTGPLMNPPETGGPGSPVDWTQFAVDALLTWFLPLGMGLVESLLAVIVAAAGGYIGARLTPVGRLFSSD